MNPGSWGIAFPLLANAVMFHMTPRISRPDILFSVTVPEAFANGEGRSLVSRFRAIIWISTSIGLALMLFVPPPGPDSLFLPAAVTAGNMAVALAAWVWAYRKARPHAVVSPAMRAASLAIRDTSLPGGTLFAFGPIGILVAAALLVNIFAEGPAEPDGRLGPFGHVAAGAVYVAVMLITAMSMTRQTRQVAPDGPAAAAEHQFRRVNVFMLIFTAYAVAILMSANTLGSLPAFERTPIRHAWLLIVPAMAGNALVMFWMLRVGQGGQRAAARVGHPVPSGDATPDHAWKAAGLFYFNRGDSAIWVEKRIGLGYTLNFGNWRAWLLMAMFMTLGLSGAFLF